MENTRQVERLADDIEQVADTREKFGIVRLPEFLWADSSNEDGGAKLAWLLDLMPERELLRAVDSGQQGGLLRADTSMDRDVQGLIQAMAGFSPSTAGETSMLQTYALAIGAVVVANPL